MSNQERVLDAEQQFFNALTSASIQSLESILSPDFILIDLTGAVIDRASLLAVTESAQLKFSGIRVIESAVRLYGSTAVVTGRTEMSGAFGGHEFKAASRYTHVYVEAQGHWLLASAQGTPIA